MGLFQRIEELSEYRQMLATALQRLRKLKAEGNSVEEIVEEQPLATSKKPGAMAYSRATAGSK